MKKNPVVHFEIYARDAEKLAKFYSTLFDWSIDAMPGMDYHYVKTVDTMRRACRRSPAASTAASSCVRRDSKTRGWINYINVDSLDEAVKRAQDLGARVMKGRAAVPGMGWFAMLVDPQGNSFAMWERDPNAK